MFKTALRLCATAAMMAALAGCTTITLAPAGPLAVSGGYSVTLGRNWSDASILWAGRPSHARMLTIDGPALNQLYITDGLAPGEALVRAVRAETRTPTYRANMSPTELVEFVSDSVSLFGYQRVTTRNLRPGQFAGGEAIRFDIAAQTRPGLDINGTALIAEHGGKLYLILYLAPAEHYYGASLAEVEQIMGSVRMGMIDLTPYALAERAQALEAARVFAEGRVRAPRG